MSETTTEERPLEEMMDDEGTLHVHEYRVIENLYLAHDTQTRIYPFYCIHCLHITHRDVTLNK